MSIVAVYNNSTIPFYVELVSHVEEEMNPLWNPLWGPEKPGGIRVKPKGSWGPGTGDFNRILKIFVPYRKEKFEDPTEGKEYPPNTKMWIRNQEFMAMLLRYFDADDLNQFLLDTAECAGMVNRHRVKIHDGGWLIKEDTGEVVPVKDVWKVDGLKEQLKGESHD